MSNHATMQRLPLPFLSVQWIFLWQSSSESNAIPIDHCQQCFDPPCRILSQFTFQLQNGHYTTCRNELQQTNNDKSRKKRSCGAVSGKRWSSLNRNLYMPCVSPLPILPLWTGSYCYQGLHPLQAQVSVMENTSTLRCEKHSSYNTSGSTIVVYIHCRISGSIIKIYIHCKHKWVS
jgi:hypothetical protein